MRSLRVVAIYTYEHQAGVEYIDKNVKRNKEMEQRSSYVLPRASHLYCYLTAELSSVAIFGRSNVEKSQLLPS